VRVVTGPGETLVMRIVPASRIAAVKIL